MPEEKVYGVAMDIREKDILVGCGKCKTDPKGMKHLGPHE